MHKLLILSVFCFAAASAGLLGAAPYGAAYGATYGAAYGAPYGATYGAAYGAYAPYAPYASYGHAYAAPVVAHAPVAYHAPVVKTVVPAAYHTPVLAKAVIPAATSYANTYKVSSSVTPVVHAPYAPYVAHAPIVKSYAAPAVVAHSPYGYGGYY